MVYVNIQFRTEQRSQKVGHRLLPAIGLDVHCTLNKVHYILNTLLCKKSIAHFKYTAQIALKTVQGKLWDKNCEVKSSLKVRRGWQQVP